VDREAFDAADAAAPGSDVLHEELERVRHILFGVQKAEIHNGLDSLRQQLSQEVERLSADQEHRIKTRDGELRAALSLLHARLGTEKAAFEEGIRRSAGHAKDQVQLLAARVDELQQQAGQTVGLAQKLAAQAELLQASLQRADERATRLERQLAKLGDLIHNRDQEARELLQSSSARMHGEIQQLRESMLEALRQLRAVTIHELAIHPAPVPLLTRVISHFSRRTPPFAK
jgi:chromosome segregation ATPase